VLQRGTKGILESIGNQDRMQWSVYVEDEFLEIVENFVGYLRENETVRTYEAR